MIAQYHHVLNLNGQIIQQPHIVTYIVRHAQHQLWVLFYKAYNSSTSAAPGNISMNQFPASTPAGSSCLTLHGYVQTDLSGLHSCTGQQPVAKYRRVCCQGWPPPGVHTVQSTEYQY
jgi:hypothetical protein